MENKYFTPDIEDFYIGYEYETIYLKSVWTKESLRLMDAGWFFESYNNDAVPTEFRVPYLTKEQIEAEGWTHIGEKFISETEQTYFKGNFILYYANSKLRIVNEDEDWSYEVQGGVKFDGKCRCINEFRKIIKLLEI